MAELIELTDLFQTLVDLDPCAVIFRVDFALAVLLAAAGAVDQALGALGHGTDTAGLAENAVAAVVAGFFPYAEADSFTEVHGVVGRIGGDAGRVFGHALHTVAAGHADDAVRLGSDQGLHLALDAEIHAAVIRDRCADDLFPGLFEGLGQGGDLRLAAGMTCRCAAVAADDRNCLCIADHRHELFHGLLLRNNHANVSLRMKCGRGLISKDRGRMSQTCDYHTPNPRRNQHDSNANNEKFLELL